MQLEIPDRWIVLRIARDPESWVYRDDRGHRLPVADVIELRRLVGEAMTDLPVRQGAHVNRPVPLPVFVDPPPGPIDWEPRVAAALSPLDADRIQLVQLARARWARRPPLRLPLDVLAVGEWSARTLEGVVSTAWYSESQMRAFGLRVTTVAPGAVREGMRVARDIVVAETSAVPRVLAAARLALRSRLHPRLLIVIVPPNAAPANLSGVRLPSGMSLLQIVPLTQQGAPGFLTLVLYGLIHDLPLHETTKAAWREGGSLLGHPPLLVADPESNQDLRLAGTLGGVLEDALTLESTVLPGDVRGFVRRVSLTTPREITQRLNVTLSRAERQARPIQVALHRAEDLHADFSREIRGFEPVASAESTLFDARAAEAEVTRTLRDAATDPSIAEIVRRHQVRRLDVSLERLEYSPVIDPFGPAYRARLVSSNVALRRRARYRVRVTIGRPQRGTLMVGEVPPLDPLLPDPEAGTGHTLDVTLWEGDFTVLSARVQALYLPLLGGSAPVLFEIRAPDRDGSARLRIGAYYRDHLLQSFVLDAQIADEEWADPDTATPRLAVRLDFSRTERFTNLDQLSPRRLCIGVNEDRGGATHSFMFKRKGIARPVHLTEAVLQGQITRFRDILHAATVDKQKQPRFPSDPAAGAAPSALFHEMVRTFAQHGRALYRALYTRASPEMKAELRAVAQSNDEIVQVVRHDPNYAFPWSVLYDFQLPKRLVGVEPPPVCLGQAGARCAHGPDDAVYCIYGFWGIRHHVEQLVAVGGTSKDAEHTIERPPNRPSVLTAIGIDDQHAVGLRTALGRDLGLQAIAELEPTEDLLDVLWSATSRPAVLVALAHVETRELPGQPIGTRLVLVPGQRWLQADDITDREQQTPEGWERPRPIILLLGCGTGETDIATLNDFVIALCSAGAAAVIATESVIFSSLGARFAREVAVELWNRGRLGAAVTAFRRRLLQSGNPLAFAFTPVGDAELMLA